MLGQDTDGDGVADTIDLDDDNDGILDLVENSNCDIALKTEDIVLFSENFGTGTSITSNSDVTNLTYDPTGNINQGDYAVASSLSPGLDKNATTNLTGDLDANIDQFGGPANGSTNGRYLAISLDQDNIDIYQKSISGLIINEDYRFRVDLVGPCGARDCEGVGFFRIEIRDNSSNVLASFSTSGLGLVHDDVWTRIALNFTASTTDIVIAIVSEQLAASGNFVGIDNIVVSSLTCTGSLADLDADGVINSLDLDSDNDGIPDNIEAQTTTGYIAPNADDLATYATNDGVNTAYLGGLIPVDTDGIGEADYLDLDSDTDGLFDINESGGGLADADNDGRTDGAVGSNGLDDTLDNGGVDDYSDINGSYDNTQTDNFTDADNDVGLGGNVDYRDTSIGPDSDMDGVADAVDLDDDNDGILDNIEDGNCDISIKEPADILFSEDFGTGATRATNAFVTIHAYEATMAINDGYYAVISSGQTGGLGLFNRTDQTGDLDANIDLNSGPGGGSTNGRYLVVNLTNSAPIEFYRQSITNLTPGNDYQLRLDFSGLCSGCADLPIFRLEIRNTSGTVLHSMTSSQIGIANDDVWRRGLIEFTATVQEVDIVMVNEQPGGSGNDLGIDNIVLNSLSCPAPLNDTDGDGIINSLDLDADNDGIPDNTEAQTTAGYISPNNDDLVSYITNNGVNTAYLGGLSPVNTDGTDNPDFLDTDADNDGLFDIDESGEGLTDANNDGATDGAVGANGLDNSVDNAMMDDYSDVNGQYDNTPSDNFTDTDSDASQSGGNVDFRDLVAGVDHDGDGIDDDTDLDDDNDGIPDFIEDGNCDITAKEEVEVLFSEDFGTGDTRTTNSNVQNHNYRATGSVPDGDYAVARSLNAGLAGYNRTELTGDRDANIDQFTGPAGGSTNGRYLIINMINQGNTEFYRQSITGLVIGDDYRFRLDMAGLCTKTSCPDIPIFRLEIQNTSGGVLHAVSSASLGIANDDVWRRAVLNFTATTNDIEIVIINDQPSGSGNDVGVDNIVFGRLLCPVNLNDSDGDGIYNSLDLDSDNDGIPDNIEAQTTIGYIAPSGVSSNITDANNNGLDDNYESGQGGTDLSPVNTDGTDEPDYLDLDSDNDNDFDIVESGLALTDANVDGRTDGTVGANGLDNAVDNGGIDDYSDVNGAFDDTQTDNFLDVDEDVLLIMGDVDYRETNNNVDTDRDGIEDSIDIDDDNDGILDTIEGNISPSVDTVVFQFTGADQTYTVADDVTSITAKIWGAGGRGDTEAGRGVGGAGGYTEFTISKASLLSNDLILTVGEGGNSSEGAVNYGNGGAGLVGTGTGNGRNYGSGGGMSAISYLSLSDPNSVDPQNLLAIAGGGGSVPSFTSSGDRGGVGGGTTGGNGTFSGNSNGEGGSQSSGGYSEGNPGAYLLGGNAVVDGAAGGGGYYGGGSGYLKITNEGLGGGGSGFVSGYGTGNTTPGNLQTPPNTGDPDYILGVGEGGNSGGTNGGNGLIVLLVTRNNPVDDDDDGIINSLDIDSDNDGIPDNVEAQTTTGYIAPSGVANSITDNNGNGLDDNYETAQGGTDIVPVNTDGTDDPDYLDPNSDNDDDTDARENGYSSSSISGFDTDGDGLDDAFEGSNLDDPNDVNDEIDTPSINLPDLDTDVNEVFGDVDYRDVLASPGGVTNDLLLWLRADEGGISWNDQSGQNVTVTEASSAITSASLLNFNANNSFPGSTHYDTNLSINAGIFSEISAISVFIPSIGTANSVWGETQSNSASYLYFEHSANELRVSDGNSLDLITTSNQGVPVLVSTIIKQSNSVNSTVYINGEATYDFLSSHSTTPNNLLDVGASGDGGNQFNGQIAEIIFYNANLSNGLELQKVESYLALKYGFTLSRDTDGDGNVGESGEGDYLASDGAIWWNASLNSVYTNNVAGIARDDASNFMQRQSKSINPDAIVTIGLDSETDGLENSNVSNPNYFTLDKSALVWAHDGANLNDGTAGLSEYDPNQVESRLNREWIARKTGTVGFVTIEFDVSNLLGPDNNIGTSDESQILLMLDDDGDFSSGATTVSQSFVETHTDGKVAFSVNLTSITDQVYFTLASGEPGALPITLMNFEAELSGDQVLIAWQTITETNNALFRLERSSDGLNFEILSLVDGSGTSELYNEYEFIDKSPIVGYNYYRLVNISNTGEEETSDVISVLYQVDSEYIIVPFPNPVKSGHWLNLDVPTNAQVGLIKLYDIKGTSIEFEYSAQAKSIKMASTFSGLAILTMVVDGKVHKHKIRVNR
ncbi:hypothetical protein BFP97_04635 [Roseivirga sp. 4D4]|uniref:beta strand repeat-containing protein n=1 Tax=Roseivirga sp. 4D4 TaxID=1889784 RepID=UPI000852F308|nr:glycine-rich protein [Roseivirga sp. 4D4]OEK00838.1 hypothetical protein BFP97_04635 [Roseivirga sp. 4D4]